MSAAKDGTMRGGGMTESVAWPGPPSQKPWWFDDASPRWQERYLKQWERAGRSPHMSTRRYREERQRAPLYIRAGGLPGEWKYSSRSLAEMRRKRPNPKLEKGLSVFRGYKAPDGDGYVVDTATPAQASMWMMVVLEARDIYLAEGIEIALGSDQEPVLASLDVELTPLEPGTRVRSSGRYRGMSLFVESLASRGPLMTFAKAVRIPQEIRVGQSAPVAPAESLAALAEGVAAGALKADSPVHGTQHWRRVAVAGARLLEETPREADPLSVLLFALMHDSQRMYETYDAWHGWRAARLAHALLKGSGLVSAEQLDTLMYALEVHDEGLVSDDPTVGACWDADRLCLWRVGITPDPKLLSTEAARKPETIAWARELQRRSVSWVGACQRLGLTEPEHLATAEVLDGAHNVTLEDVVRERLRRWGIPEEEHERAIRASGFGGLIRGLS